MILVTFICLNRGGQTISGRLNLDPTGTMYDDVLLDFAALLKVKRC
ncbi:hypothetical protein [uncultured Sphingobacterium sp.]|nr:hypothetical protein [uncultured Sphingobacterium sp.]